ncbi:hypothetical protein [uncultured Campylobacter sp.]|uniref:hypothetical protein n=1 Tax=uncultured Campylobacter sp. TaxID=218934 RepID=UPI00260BAEE0|nr:hypothetical protein [uncultured Campylobacter sp.]
MQYEQIKSQVKTELQNKKANDRLLKRIANQLKITEKAEASAAKERQKLEKLVQEKNDLVGASATEASQEE